MKSAYSKVNLDSLCELFRAEHPDWPLQQLQDHAARFRCGMNTFDQRWRRSQRKFQNAFLVGLGFERPYWATGSDKSFS